MLCRAGVNSIRNWNWLGTEPKWLELELNFFKRLKLELELTFSGERNWMSHSVSIPPIHTSYHVLLHHSDIHVNKKDRWDSGKPRRHLILFCDIQIKVLISRMQIYVYHTDLIPLKIWVTLTLTFQCHSRSTLTMPLESPYKVSY